MQFSAPGKSFINVAGQSYPVIGGFVTVPDTVVLTTDELASLTQSGVKQLGVQVTSSAGSSSYTVRSEAVGSSLLLKAGPGALNWCSATVPAAGYLMIFDSLTEPADGPLEPLSSVFTDRAGTFGIDYAPGSQAFQVGALAVFSTTGPLVKTAAATAFFNASIAS